jgi:PUA domain protein
VLLNLLLKAKLFLYLVIIFIMPNIKQLNNKESKEIILYFKEFGINLKETRFEIAKDKIDLLISNKRALGFYYNQKLYPSLRTILEYNLNLPNIYLDLGAIPFITKGADLMKPGIKELENFDKGQLVIMCDAIHKKALALGIAEFNSNEIKTMEKGKVIKTIHYIGDSIWNYGNK